MTVTVIDRPLLGISENRVGLADFFEFILRVGIVRIPVGMKLQRQFAISALQFLLGAGASDAQYLIIIAFCVRGQNRPSNERKYNRSGTYLPGLRATFTIAGRSKRSLNLYPRCNSSST